MLGMAVAGGPAMVASAQVDYGFDFVPIGAVGNPAYSGPDPTGYMTGHGGVGYEYRIGRTEVTTAQWLGFVNTFTMREDPSIGLEFLPLRWGATQDLNYQGPGSRWMLQDDLPMAEMLPVVGISWRRAAQFCNWLHNGRSEDITSLAGRRLRHEHVGVGPGLRIHGRPDTPTRRSLLDSYGG